ncbi:MAG: restriction endonuclease [Thermoplasmata archaeon]
MVGLISGEYRHDTETLSRDYPNLRPVNWKGVVDYDNVPREIWRSMTAWQTVFELSSPDAIEAARRLVEGLETGHPPEPPESMEERTLLAMEEGQILYEETVEKTSEISRRHFENFSGREFQELVWEMLRAAGLHPKPMQSGADRGVDTEAYRDPLQLGPRILVQVKHRQGQARGPDIQQFVGTMNREGDVGLFVSTSGFSSAARTVAERSLRQVSLMDWDRFVELFLDVYDRLDNAIKARVPIATARVLIQQRERKRRSWT